MNALNPISGTSTTFNTTLPFQQVTVGNVPENNVNFVRSFTLSNEVVKVSRGSVSACIPNSAIAAALVAIAPGLTYPPIFSLQPVSSSVHVGDGAEFDVLASGEFDSVYPITYQWTLSTDSGQTFNNVVDSAIYNGATTPNMIVTPPDIGYSGYIYRCVATSTPGSTISNGAVLTIT